MCAIQQQLSRTEGDAKLYSLFVDLTQAFDSIVHKMLWIKLKNKGVSVKFIERIKKLYEAAKTKIRASGGTSEFIKILIGVLQGEILSPKLFTLFLDDLVEILYLSGSRGIKINLIEIIILLFADDMIIMATNHVDLQRQINILVKYFKEYELKVNLNKTKVVVFRKGGYVSKKLKLYWDGKEIEIVNNYTYLGVEFFK